MTDDFRRVHLDHEVPDFGDARIRYGQSDNDQLIYVDDLPAYALAMRVREPLSPEELYKAYLQSIIDIEKQTEAMRKEMRDYPAAIRRAEHQPEGGGGTFCIQGELATCWVELKADPSVDEPEAKMIALSEWFAEQVKAAVLQEMADNPVDPDALSEEE